jgi:hypothetical protein
MAATVENRRNLFIRGKLAALHFLERGANLLSLVSDRG